MTFSYHDLLLLVVPGLIAVITKSGWPGPAKYLITIAACVLAALAEFYLTDWITGGAQGSFIAAFAKSFLVIFGSYAGIWKPTTLADRVESRING